MENSTFNKKIIFLLIGILILPFFTNAESILNNKALQTTMVINEESNDVDSNGAGDGDVSNGSIEFMINGEGGTDIADEELININVDDEANIIANINVYKIAMTQNDRQVDIEFEIGNDGNYVQPQIKYSVVLERVVDKDEGGSEYGVMVDEYVYDDVISLSPGMHNSNNITYLVPSGFYGEYRVTFLASNSSGLPLLVAVLDKITVKKSEKSVFINPDLCILKLNEKEEMGLWTGVDVANDEKLTLVCRVQSGFEEPILMQPRIRIYDRTVFGEMLTEKYLKDISIIPGNETVVELDVDTMRDPQAYDIVVSLVDKDNDISSNSVSAHYVIQGESATIQNIRLDKDRYKNGDVAKILYDFSGRADVFENSRALIKEENLGDEFNIFFSVVINDGNGERCASESSLLYDKELSWDIDVKKDCNNPIVAVELTNERGEVLDEMVVSIKSSPQKEYAIYNSRGIKYGIGGGLFLVLFITGGILIVNHRKKGMISSIVVLVGLGWLFFSASSTQALTLKPSSPWSSQPYFTINVTPVNTLDCEGRSVSGRASVPNCSNTVQSYMNVKMNNKHFANYYGACHTRWRAPHGSPFDKESYCTGLYYSRWISGKCFIGNENGSSPGYHSALFGMNEELCKALVASRENFKWDGQCYVDVSEHKDKACPDSQSGDSRTTIRNDAVLLNDHVGNHSLKFSASFHRTLTARASNTVNGILKYNVTGVCPLCGNDNNKTFTNRPGSSLCMNTNVFQWTDATANDGTWNWKCGNTANCSANRVFGCTGAYPRNVTVCNGSTRGLTVDTPWNKVDSCAGAGKCTYTARCIVQSRRSGRPPYGAEWCPNSHKGLVVNTLWRKVHRCSGRKCEYIVPAKCGTDHEKSFDTTAELTTSGKYCGVRSVKFDFKDNSGVTDNGGTAWTWGCRRESQIVKCEAYKNGECNDTPKKSPYKQKEYACKVGSFNSVSLGDIDTKPVLTWKCGTGKSKKSNGSPATPKYIGDFFSGNADKAPQVAFDNYTPTSGGVNCKCYPEYSYVCSCSDADCSNKCDGYALSVAVATKHDTECFPAEIKSISKTEFNLNKNSNQEECENKQIKCAACGANSAETGEGGIWHESH